MGLIDTLFSECVGYLELRAISPNYRRSEFFRLSDTQGIRGFIAANKKHELYFAVATRDGGGGKKENIVDIPAVWTDIDFKQIDESDAMKRIDEFPFKPTVIVASGGGLHCYWKLREPAEKVDTDQVEAVMRAIATQLGGDMACTDASRILRIPNTENHKYKPARKVFIKYQNGSSYNLSDFEDLLPVVGTVKSQPTPAQPTDHLEAVMQCKFMRHCRDDAATLPEAEWYCMISNLVRVAGGRGKIHELSKPYPKYKARETDQKILHAIDASNPHTCQKIKELWDCGSDCGVKSPTALRKNVLSATSATSATSMQLATSGNIAATYGQLQEHTKRASVLAKVRDWLEFSDGVFHYVDLARDMQFNVLERNQLRPLLHKMVLNREIERVGSRTGQYRKVIEDTAIIKWWEASSDEYEVSLPLAIGSFAKLFPGNIVVIAGESNAAKTALLLEIARLNINSHTIRYQSSEMEGQELRNRLSLYQEVCSLDEWRKIDFRRCPENHQDVLLPDGLNIIDYIEIHDEFWKLGGTLRAIHDNLGDGICIVAMQKKPGSDVGKGGYVSLEKPRLYLSVGFEQTPGASPYNVCKVVKCKAYRERDQNPHGLKRKFKVYDGWEIKPLGDWYHE